MTERTIAAPFVIAVFGSGICDEIHPNYEVAKELGAGLAGAGFSIATGGYAGCMEAVSRGAAEAGGHVVGVVTSAFVNVPNRWLSETVVVPTWEERLLRLMALAHGYVACPGGTGSLAELAVAWERMQKGLTPRRPLIALGEFWGPVITLIESADPGAAGWVSLAANAEEAVSILRGALHSA